MDAKCVRVLRPYEEKKEKAIYIDEDAKYSLMMEWGDKITVSGRYTVKEVEIKPLKPMDQEGFMARVGKELLDELYVEYGEEVMLSRE